jgi:hypothetical protein
MHGISLSINHAWRLLARKLWRDKVSYARVMQPIGVVVTFVAVAASMVFFRSSTVHAAMNIVRGMIGLNGTAVPASVVAHLGPVGTWLHVRATPPEFFPFAIMAEWLAALAVIVFLCPNTQEILARYEPALGVKPNPSGGGLLSRVAWKPSIAWALIVAAIAVFGVLQLGGPSEFLYWQF